MRPKCLKTRRLRPGRPFAFSLNFGQMDTTNQRSSLLPDWSSGECSKTIPQGRHAVPIWTMSSSLMRLRSVPFHKRNESIIAWPLASRDVSGFFALDVTPDPCVASFRVDQGRTVWLSSSFSGRGGLPKNALDNGCTLKIGQGEFRGLMLSREPTLFVATSVTLDARPRHIRSSSE